MVSKHTLRWYLNSEWYSEIHFFLAIFAMSFVVIFLEGFYWVCRLEMADRIICLFTLVNILNRIIYIISVACVCVCVCVCVCEEFACSAGDLGLIPGSGRSPEGGHGNLL